MAETMDREGLRGLYGHANERAAAKQLAQLDGHCRHFISLSPLVIVASADAEGRCDASPRGDAPGFVAVLDDHHLLLPDRRGNNRIDTLMNVAENPRLGLLFLVPGVNETLRVNGRVRLVAGPDQLAPHAVQGQIPKSGLLMEVEEVFFHCAKAFLRSDFWNPAKHAPKGAVPSLGRILADQIGGGRTAETEDQAIQHGYRTALY